MFDHSRKSADIATKLHDELGVDAFSFVSSRVEEARQVCDERGVRLWKEVAAELLKLGPGARNFDGRSGANRLWGVMQRIEYYRHRATEVELKAAAAPEAYRQDMLELAGQWRDLALYADLQARLTVANSSVKDI